MAAGPRAGATNGGKSLKLLGRTPRPHVAADEYNQWLKNHFRGARHFERLVAYDAIVTRWPSLDEWLAAPPDQRMGPNGDMRQAVSTYLAYCSLVDGIGLDYRVVLAGSVALFSERSRPEVFGIDLDRFRDYTFALGQLGIPRLQARRILGWSLGAILLHRGDPALAAIGARDVDELCDAVRGMGLVRVPSPRDASVRGRWSNSVERRTIADSYPEWGDVTRSTLMIIGQIPLGSAELCPPRPGAPDLGGQPIEADQWVSALARARVPSRIAQVVDGYVAGTLTESEHPAYDAQGLQLGFRLFLWWLDDERHQVTSLVQLTRRDMADFMEWLAELGRRQLGRPFGTLVQHTVVAVLAPFFAEITSWVHDVPHEVLLTAADLSPEMPRPGPWRGISGERPRGSEGVPGA